MRQIRKRVIPQSITELKPNEIFVFGSNIGGLHGGGAARTAMQWGAVWGQGVGLQGQTYAIPTMDGSVKGIKPYVDEFIEFAKQSPDKVFLVTEIGCGIAGYTPAQIAPLFAEAAKIKNIHLPQSFWEIISEEVLEYMSLAELEQSIIALWEENNSRKNRNELEDCISERKHRMDRDHPMTTRELTELKRVNRLITKHTFRVCAEVEELFEKLKNDVLMNYNEVTVRAELYPSGDLIKYDGDEVGNYELMSEILLDEFCPSVHLLEISLSYNRVTGKENTHYMCFYDEDTRMWDDLFDFTFARHGIIDEKDAFEVYHPMHCLYDHSQYSLQDIIRISDFKSEITVTFE